MRPQPTPRQEMQAYDQLPKTLREALSNSGEQFSASQMLNMLKRGHSCAELIAAIEGEDRVRDKCKTNARRRRR